MNRRLVDRASILVWSAALVVGLFAQWIAGGFSDPARWIPDLVTGWILIAAGMVAWRGRPESTVGVLLLMSGFTWFLANLTGADASWLAWIGAHGIFVHRGPLIHALVTFPTGRVADRVERAMVGIGYLASAATPVFRNEWLTILLAVALVLVAVRRHATAIGADRLARRTALRLAGVLGGTLAGVAASNLLLPGDATRYLGGLAYATAVSVTGIGLAAGLVSRPREQANVTDLVVELGEARSDSLRDSLARALGDPTLEIGYWSAALNGYVDASGRPIPTATDGENRAPITVSDGDGAPVAILVHHWSLLDDQALVDSIGTAGRLASINASRQAEVRAQIVELEESRRRLVTAGDEEHRRLEARLHAGPEHRLQVLVDSIGTARRAADEGRSRELLGEVEDRLVTTLDELRSLAAGLHPRLLTEAGLQGALAALAARCPTPVRLGVTDRRLPPPIEAAVYFVCSEALANVAKHAAAGRVSVVVAVTNDRVVVDIVDDGVGGVDPAGGTGLRNLRDRVEALGGTLEVDGQPGAGTRLVAELPLGDENL